MLLLFFPLEFLSILIFLAIYSKCKAYSTLIKLVYFTCSCCFWLIVFRRIPELLLILFFRAQSKHQWIIEFFDLFIFFLSFENAKTAARTDKNFGLLQRRRRKTWTTTAVWILNWFGLVVTTKRGQRLTTKTSTTESDTERHRFHKTLRRIRTNVTLELIVVLYGQNTFCHTVVTQRKPEAE